jgi:hypothetical protein
LPICLSPSSSARDVRRQQSLTLEGKRANVSMHLRGHRKLFTFAHFRPRGKTPCADHFRHSRAALAGHHEGSDVSSPPFCPMCRSSNPTVTKPWYDFRVFSVKWGCQPDVPRASSSPRCERQRTPSPTSAPRTTPSSAWQPRSK